MRNSVRITNWNCISKNHSACSRELWIVNFMIFRIGVLLGCGPMGGGGGGGGKRGVKRYRGENINFILNYFFYNVIKKD